jgi:cell wall-associated NlpC family hydrolase
VDATWLKVSLPGGQEGFIRSDAARPKQLLTKIDLVTLSQQFLYTPYKWGGRSAFGYDCSGFVQMLYEQIGILLPRDSKDQILDPRLKPIEEEALEGGDLLFFGTSAKNIGHVALYIGEGRFIHATARENRPWIRISRLSDAPWLPTETGFYPYRRAICF